MKNSKYARVLKYYRKLNNLSAAELANILTDNGYPLGNKAIYNWENGVSQPSADVLMFLCEYYKIYDVLGAFGSKKNAKTGTFSILPPSKEDMQIIEAYHKHVDLQPAIKKLLDLDSNKK